ncbi:MAG TPA: SRPBCC domain-containing protein [Kofleriaceae bacterium]|nr:SRPBCC domain-containing protein [Kofleriaceae bacterium]
MRLVEAHVRRPRADVREAVVDAARLAKFFVSRASGPLETGATVTWEWTDVGASTDVRAREIRDDRITFLWGGEHEPTQVEISLVADGDVTKVTIDEHPFELAEEAAVRAIRQTQGWTEFCCGLRAYLEHGIDLRRGGDVA